MMRAMIDTAKFPFQLLIDIILIVVNYLKGTKNEN